MPTKIEKDAVTGVHTTGHVWDGIAELNNPLPKWWLYVLYATIIAAVVWFVLYPAIPGITGHTAGTLGYSARREAMEGVRKMHERHAEQMGKIASTDVDKIRQDPQLMAVATTAGRVAFADNCQPCHGTNGEGRVGYPALGDDVWLWGGKPADLQKTITYGIRSGHPDARGSQMPAFGADGILKPAEVEQVADYVLTLYGLKKDGDVSAGAKLFAENCVACHGEKGEGNRDVGAPRLASATHLYGSDRASVIAQVNRPRQGVMPAWVGRLDTATIKSLAVYVHALGGGE